MMKRIFIIICTATLFLPFAKQLRAETNPSEWPIVLMQDVKSAIRQAEARFQSGNVSGAADLARRILEKYPNNADAQAILDKCIAMEKSDYDAAIKSLNVEQLEAFQKKYPSSSYNDSIERHIDDVPLWNIARKGNTIESYKRYLSESSHHLFKQEANDAIRDITVKQAYDAAVLANTIKAFEQFRNSFPGSKFDNDASNKIARLMADMFNSRSTYSDRSNALAYAKNEMTRDYVNNKYNSATRYKSSSSASASSRSSSTNTSHSASSSTSSSTVHPDGPTSRRFGVSAFYDFSYINDYFGDADLTHSYGIGMKMRFGDQRWPLNMILGAGVICHNARIHSSYIDDNYYDRDIVNTYEKTEIVLSPELHWNMMRTESVGMYLGVGYQGSINTQSSHAIKVFFGVPWLHGDWNVYYMKYFMGPYFDDGLYAPNLGMSYTYYF